MSDAFEPRSVHRGRFRPFASFLMALRFLTRMPVPFVRTVDPPPLKDSMWMFPVVGAFVGTITGAALMLALVARLPDRSRREYETGSADMPFKQRLNTSLVAAACGCLCLEWIVRRLAKLA